jgi:hypothetical protein
MTRYDRETGLHTRLPPGDHSVKAGVGRGLGWRRAVIGDNTPKSAKRPLAAFLGLDTVARSRDRSRHGEVRVPVRTHHRRRLPPQATQRRLLPPHIDPDANRQVPEPLADRTGSGCVQLRRIRPQNSLIRDKCRSAEATTLDPVDARQPYRKDKHSSPPGGAFACSSWSRTTIRYTHASPPIGYRAATEEPAHPARRPGLRSLAEAV